MLLGKIGKSILKRKPSKHKLTPKEIEELKKIAEERRKQEELEGQQLPKESSDEKPVEEKRGLTTILSPLEKKEQKIMEEMPDKEEQLKKGLKKRLKRR